MSVKERMKVLGQQEEENRRIAEAIEKKRQKEWLAKYSQELPQVKERQATLLEELQKLGVVGMLEEATETGIPPLVIRAEGGKLPQETTSGKQLLAEVQEVQRLYDLQKTQWGVSIPRPDLSKEGNWDVTLKIKAKKKLQYPFKPYLEIDSDSVLVTYSEDKILTISGEEVTFSGHIPGDKNERTEVLEEALARAFLNPKREQPKPPPEYREIIIQQ